MKKPKAVRFTDELEGQDSPVLAVMKYYGSPLTRDEYVAVAYLGTLSPDDPVPEEVEETWPEQFRRKTLVEAPPLSAKIQ